MNMPAKVCLGAGAFLVMSGGLLAVTGLASGAQTHLDFPWGGGTVAMGTAETVVMVEEMTDVVSSEESYVEEYTTLDDFSRLDVDIDIGDVIVEYGEDYGISLTGRGGIQLEYELDGGTLQVRSGAGAWELFDWEHQITAVITLPEGAALESAEFRTDIGDVRLLGVGVTVDTLTAESGMGDVELFDVAAEDAVLTLSMGHLTAQGLTTYDSLSVENAMGEVYLEGSFQGDTECNLSMGDLELYTDVPADDYGLDMRVSMGALYLNGSEQRSVMTSPGGPHTLTVDSGMGDVRVEFGG